MRRRNGLHFELDVLEPGQFKSASETTLRILAVLFRFCAHKAHGPAGDRGIDSGSELLFRLFFQIAKNACDQIFDGDAPAKNFRRSKAAAGQKRFQRLNQASARFAGKVMLDSFRTSPGGEPVLVVFASLLQIQQRPIGFRGNAEKRDAKKVNTG